MKIKSEFIGNKGICSLNYWIDLCLSTFKILQYPKRIFYNYISSNPINLCDWFVQEQITESIEEKSQKGYINTVFISLANELNPWLTCLYIVYYIVWFVNSIIQFYNEMDEEWGTFYQ